MPVTDRLPVFQDVEDAARRLEKISIKTPLLEFERLNERAGARVLLKCEMFQPIGAFKIRGAWNMMTQIAEADLKRGVVAFSSGNHAQAVAWSARRLGIGATIVMPSDAPAVKIGNTRALGADIRLYDRTTEDREAIAKDITNRNGAIVVPPYDHPDVIAGQGTVGLEIARQCKSMNIEPDIVVVPCSGGGLIAGTSLAIAALLPGTEIYSAEPENFDDTARSLAAGERLDNDPGQKSICDALLVQTPGVLTFEINRRTLAGGVAVSEDEVRSAISVAFDDTRLVIEPGGAAGLAAILSGKPDIHDKTVCVVLSGGNIDRQTFSEIIRSA